MKLNKFKFNSIFVLCFFLAGSLSEVLPVYAKGKENTPSRSLKRPRSDEKDPEIYLMHTPNRTHRDRPISFSPHSNLKNAIYLFHDLNSKELSLIKKVDFEGKKVSLEEFHHKIAEWENWAQTQRSEGRLYQFHRYIGLVTQGLGEKRTAVKRFREHGTACNSRTDDVEKRFCLGLNQALSRGQTPEMLTLVYGVHPSQIQAFEAYFIYLFGGLEDLGWNSNPGHLERYQEFFKVPLYESRRIKFNLDR